MPTYGDGLDLYHEYTTTLANLRHDKAGGHTPTNIELDANYHDGASWGHSM